MASQQVAALIGKLSTDPSLNAEYKASPEPVMDREGLSEEDKQVMRTGDADKIRAYMGDDAPPGCLVLID